MSPTSDVDKCSPQTEQSLIDEIGYIGHSVLYFLTTCELIWMDGVSWVGTT